MYYISVTDEQKCVTDEQKYNMSTCITFRQNILHQCCS